jgi:hypothetical protein
MKETNVAAVTVSVLLVFLIMPGAAGAQPMILWGNPAGPWSSGASGTVNSDGLVQTAVANTFTLVGSSTAWTLSWSAWGSGTAIAVDGNSPWESAELWLQGIGWIEEGNTAADPWDVSSASMVWEHNTIFGPPSAPNTFFGGSFGPAAASFVVQPGVTYTLKQWNLSRLNFFDLGHFSAEIASDVSVVPEPQSGILLIAGIAGLGAFGAGRRRAGRRKCYRTRLHFTVTRSPDSEVMRRK